MIKHNIDNKIDIGAQLIRNGELVIFPTDTVYGIGADATNNIACNKIFQIKERPAHNPLIIHTYSIEEAFALGDFNNNAKLLSTMWPGPLTIIVPKKKHSPISSIALASLTSIAIRIPNCQIALKLLQKAQRPIAAPSVNKSCKTSSTLVKHFYRDFTNKKIFHIAKRNEYMCGIESTVVDATTEQVQILRPGMITNTEIENILSKNINNNNNYKNYIAPGMIKKHYSTETKIRLNATKLQNNEIGLNFGNSNLRGNFTLNLSKNGDLKEAAFNLFKFLHHLDKHALSNENINTIAIAPIPSNSIGIAINDRINKASYQGANDTNQSSVQR